MITRSEVRIAVNEAALNFEKCWSFLASMKAGRLPSEKEFSILQFQPHLAQSIFNLSSLYCRLSAEKEYWIKRKVQLSPMWFKRRMRFLDSQQTVAQQSIQIGKSLGDGFAWFFYQNNRQFLLEHLKQPEQLLIPPGIGGAAELEVVKNLPLTNGQFLLYHGITSILRLGDFSLVDIKDGLRVTTIGEIKAGKPSDGKLEIVILFPRNGDESDARIEPLNKQASTTQKSRTGVVEGLIPSARDRLARQIKRLAESQPKINSKPDKKLSLEMEDRIKDVDSFLASINVRRPLMHQFGNSVLLIGVQLPRGTLYDRLDNKAERDFKHDFAGLESAALALMLQGSSNNSIYLNSWFFRDEGKLSHRPGMTHPIWWPVTAHSIRRVLFQEVLVMTILNPAHLLDAIQGQGYAVKADWPRSFVAEKHLGNRMISLQGIPHYLELLQHYFFSETDVLGFLQQVEDQLALMPPNGAGQISLHIEQHFGRPLE